MTWVLGFHATQLSGYLAVAAIRFVDSVEPSRLANDSTNRFCLWLTFERYLEITDRRQSSGRYGNLKLTLFNQKWL